jgi:hypothetical protein
VAKNLEQEESVGEETANLVGFQLNMNKKGTLSTLQMTGRTKVMVARD